MHFVHTVADSGVPGEEPVPKGFWGFKILILDASKCLNMKINPKQEKKKKMKTKDKKKEG